MTSKKSSSKIKPHHFIKHETKRKVLLKFTLVFFIFLGYFIFIANKYGLQQGFFVSILSWSFFVLCTPVADAGFLLDFPLRLVTNVKMTLAEIFVWLIAILLNLYTFFIHPEIYAKTQLLTFFKHILEQPFPFWLIILISAVGTFVSIKFGDELLDKVHHSECHHYHQYKNKFRLIAMFFLIVLTVVLYDFLLKKLGVDLPF
jgi:hypothetical protein